MIHLSFNQIYNSILFNQQWLYSVQVKSLSLSLSLSDELHATELSCKREKKKKKNPSLLRLSNMLNHSWTMTFCTIAAEILQHSQNTMILVAR